MTGKRTEKNMEIMKKLILIVDLFNIVDLKLIFQL